MKKKPKHPLAMLGAATTVEFILRCKSLAIGEAFDIVADPLPRSLVTALSGLNTYGDGRQVEHSPLRGSPGVRRVIRLK